MENKFKVNVKSLFDYLDNCDAAEAAEKCSAFLRDVRAMSDSIADLYAESKMALLLTGVTVEITLRSVASDGPLIHTLIGSDKFSKLMERMTNEVEQSGETD